MPLDAIIEKFNIPFSSKEITSPEGVGVKVYVDLAKEKIGKVILRKKGCEPKIGIFVVNPNANETQQPIALICEFNKQITQDIIDLTHRLCWNFCRSPLLIIIEPTFVKVFSCYQKPEIKSQSDASPLFKNVKETNTEFSAPEPIYNFNVDSTSKETKSAIKALQWLELVSGNFFNDDKHKKYFPREQKADKTLLDNLSSIRSQLNEKGLEYDTIHDLLARIIFIQFLFQREDSNGQSAISSEYLAELHNENKLSSSYESLEGILNNYDDSYKFFRLLNDRFNGDLFPGDKDEDWQEEMSKVKSEHLKLLADFISGELRLENGQFSLWKIYSFDTIPLEFISSIYEEFVSQQQHQEKNKDSNAKDSKREKGVYYTKSHLVDFMLDNVLPWDETEWDLKILDPSCGSGIFLVKAFQRLVHRWENSLSEEEKNLSDYSKRKKDKVIELLKNNLFGVDIDEHAVRVASFSLYLALCDELDPRTLWQEVTFPNLRNEQVIKEDFFHEEKPLFKKNPDIKYDLIIGNAPWGNKTLKVSEEAQSWAKNRGWVVSNNNIGTLFLPRAFELAKDNAYICLIQPTLPLLTSKLATSESFRHRFFQEFKVEEIVNLSDLRTFLFEKAGYPSCIVTMRRCSPDSQPIQYICPKKRGTDEDYRQIFIEPMDINFVYAQEAIDEPWIWTTLFLGNRRDVDLLRRLSEKPNLEKLLKEKRVQKRRGIYRPRENGNGKDYPKIKDWRILEENIFPDESFLTLNAEKLEENKNVTVSKHDTNPTYTFEPHQVFLKLSWQKENDRFKAVLVKNEEQNGVLCTSAYVNIQSEDKSLLESICFCLNSSFAVYYIHLTDGRCTFYKREPSIDTFTQISLPEINLGTVQKVEEAYKSKTAERYFKIDKLVLDSLDLNESELILVDDFFKYKLLNVHKKIELIGSEPTTRKNERQINKKFELDDYCETFFKVINAGFGKDKNVRATIFQETENNLSVRMVAIHLDYPSREEVIKIEKCSNEELWKLLRELNDKFMQKESATGNIFYQRVVRIYDNNEGVPTVYLIKPDQKRYWLRSQALRDADEVSADIVPWLQEQNHLQGAK